MKYLKLYENFVQDLEDDVDVMDPEVKLSNKTIDDVLKDDFFDDVKDTKSYIDSKGIIHIKNWKIY